MRKDGVEIMMTRKDFFSKQAKRWVDFLLVAGLIVCGIFSHHQTAGENAWQSPHCVTGGLWFLLVVVHVVQHWRVIRAFTRKKMILRNKITALTILSFVFMVISIMAFHHIAGRFFVLMVLIHAIDKCRRKK